MDIITEYKDVHDLRDKVLQVYLNRLRTDIEAHERRLADPAFASTGSGYHNAYRFKMQSQLTESRKQLKLLTE